MASLLCPACQTETVEAPTWSFSDTSVEVPVCANHGAAVSMRMKVSAIQALAVPETVSRHTDGLVTFVGV